jgi:hypothetical protein
MKLSMNRTVAFIMQRGVTMRVVSRVWMFGRDHPIFKLVLLVVQPTHRPRAQERHEDQEQDRDGAFQG